MRAFYKVITPPANTVVDVDFVARHCRLDQDYDTELLETYIQVATETVQNFLNRVCVTTKAQYTWENAVPPVSWPMVLGPSYVLPLALNFIFSHNRNLHVQLPRSPVQSVDQIQIGKYEFTQDGIPVTPTILIPQVDYIADLGVDPPRISFNRWDIYWQQEYLQIQFTTGYGDNPTDTPAPIRYGVAMVAASMYEHRNDENVEEIGLTRAVENLLANYRNYSFDGL